MRRIIVSFLQPLINGSSVTSAAKGRTFCPLGNSWADFFAATPHSGIAWHFMFGRIAGSIENWASGAVSALENAAERRTVGPLNPR